jgi:hypothetical protein
VFSFPVAEEWEPRGSQTVAKNISGGCSILIVVFCIGNEKMLVGESSRLRNMRNRGVRSCFAFIGAILTLCIIVTTEPLAGYTRYRLLNITAYIPMKKQLISTLLVVSALSFASAQTATSSAPVLPPPPTIGDTKIDAQIRALNKEMETRIRVIREEYQAKLKALIGARKAMIASTTEQLKERKAELKDERKDKVEAIREEIKDKREDARGTSTPQVRPFDNRGATTTKAQPQGNAWGFFMRFLGQPKPVNVQ